MGQTPVPDRPSIEKRADAMLTKLTLTKNIELIGGYRDMYSRPIPSPGFTQLNMSNGPKGLQTYGLSTAYKAGISLATSRDPSLAMMAKIALGQDSTARGVQFLLPPGVKITRAPADSRNFEYFGEHPFHTSRMADSAQPVNDEGRIASSSGGYHLYFEFCNTLRNRFIP